MIVVSRFDAEEDLLADLTEALQAYAGRPGFVRGRIGRAADDPSAWVLTTEWDSVGSYRRSLSSYEVKVAAGTVLGRARNEPSAFEVLQAVDLSTPGALRPSDRASDKSRGEKP